MDVAPPLANVCVSCSESRREAKFVARFRVQVELTKLEISCGNVADECADDSLASPLRCQEICSRRLVGSAIFPPEIKLPRQREIDLVRNSFRTQEKTLSVAER